MNGLSARGLLARLRRKPKTPRWAGETLLAAFATAYPRATFVEIGSNDGAQHDHLRNLIRTHDWSGVMVEPVPFVFDRLKRNYGVNPAVALENSAIAERRGTLEFHHLAEADSQSRASLPSWYDGIGSFSKEHLLSHAREIPDVEGRIVTIDVDAITFADLCERHGLSRVDLLLIDTEGYDAEILRSIDFRAHHPRVVIYEHFHLTAEDRRNTQSLMIEAGYEVMEEHFDTFCLDTSIADGVAATWAGLTPALPGASKQESG